MKRSVYIASVYFWIWFLRITMTVEDYLDFSSLIDYSISLLRISAVWWSKFYKAYVHHINNNNLINSPTILSSNGEQGNINIRYNLETFLQNLYGIVQNGDENCLGDHISAPTARTIRRRLDRKLSRANICLAGHVKRPNVFSLRYTDRIRHCQRI